MDLSIIFGTYNRLELLKQCVKSIRGSIGGGFNYEIVVTDGGSTDGSIEWLKEQPDVKLWIESERRGAVAAFNNAYSRSQGRYVMVLNDDVEVLGSALSLGVNILDGDPAIGQLAFAFSGELTGGKDIFRCFPMHRHTYANLGMIRRTVADKIVELCGGLWNPVYHTYGGDTELSCWVWRLGWVVRESDDLRCIDHLAQDALRATNNSGRNAIDGMLCHSRWPTYAHIEPMGPEPILGVEELDKLCEWEAEKLVCADCLQARDRGSYCRTHGYWSDVWNRQNRHRNAP